MNFLELFAICVGVALVSILPVLLAFSLFSKRSARLGVEIKDRLESISGQLATLEVNIVRSNITIEDAMTDAIRKVRAEIKGLEIVFRGAAAPNRENPEIVETAIRLAREGLSADMIVIRTGLPLHAVESVISLHAKGIR